MIMKNPFLSHARSNHAMELLNDVAGSRNTAPQATGHSRVLFSISHPYLVAMTDLIDAAINQKVAKNIVFNTISLDFWIGKTRKNAEIVANIRIDFQFAFTFSDMR
jgi:hypothetical protein